MRPDGKILEYRAPINVQQVLSDFSGHVISDSFQALQYLLPDTKLRGGQLYYLIPLPKPSPEVKKKVRFSTPDEESKQETGVVRIKLVISKQQLQEMLQKEGVSVDDMVSQLKDKQQIQNVDTCNNNDKIWKPVLESIPEID